MGKKLKGRKSPNGFAKKKLTGNIFGPITPDCVMSMILHNYL